jgi:hypothetical protein
VTGVAAVAVAASSAAVRSAVTVSASAPAIARSTVGVDDGSWVTTVAARVVLETRRTTPTSANGMRARSFTAPTA